MKKSDLHKLVTKRVRRFGVENGPVIATHLELPQKSYKRLQGACDATGKTKAAIITEALDMWFSAMAPKPAVAVEEVQL
jgi:predicted DNA-binding protein